MDWFVLFKTRMGKSIIYLCRFRGECAIEHPLSTYTWELQIKLYKGAYLRSSSNLIGFIPSKSTRGGLLPPPPRPASFFREIYTCIRCRLAKGLLCSNANYCLDINYLVVNLVQKYPLIDWLITSTYLNLVIFWPHQSSHDFVISCEMVINMYETMGYRTRACEGFSRRSERFDAV